MNIRITYRFIQATYWTLILKAMRNRSIDKWWWMDVSDCTYSKFLLSFFTQSWMSAITLPQSCQSLHLSSSFLHLPISATWQEFFIVIKRHTDRGWSIGIHTFQSQSNGAPEQWLKMYFFCTTQKINDSRGRFKAFCWSFHWKMESNNSESKAKNIQWSSNHHIFIY